MLYMIGGQYNLLGGITMKLVLKPTFPGLIIIFGCLLSRPAEAYIGPGSGLSAIGTFLALLAAIIVAIFGFIWYPIKRLLRKKTRDFDQDAGK